MLARGPMWLEVGIFALMGFLAGLVLSTVFLLGHSLGVFVDEDIQISTGPVVLAYVGGFTSAGALCGVVYWILPNRIGAILAGSLGGAVAYVAMVPALGESILSPLGALMGLCGVTIGAYLGHWMWKG